jgi:hypothetical protein
MSGPYQELRELSVTVRMLVDMLVDAGVIERGALQARIEAELERVRKDPTPMPDPWAPKPPPRGPAISGDPYRGDPRAEPMVTCSSCTRIVAERLTVITGDGVICDVCAARKR